MYSTNSTATVQLTHCLNYCHCSVEVLATKELLLIHYCCVRWKYCCRYTSKCIAIGSWCTLVLLVICSKYCTPQVDSKNLVDSQAENTSHVC